MPRSLLRYSVPIIIAFVSATATQSLDSAPKPKQISIQETIVFPMVNCVHGEVMPNFGIPTPAGQGVHCVTRGEANLLSPRGELFPEEPVAEIGTVIVLALSEQQVVLAADSRASLMNSRGYSGIDDSACKLSELTPKLLFAVDGMAKTDSRLPANVYYDALEEARQAAKKFEFDRSSMRENETTPEIAAKWGWELFFRIQKGVTSGWYRPRGPIWIEGIFAGLEPDGSISVAIASLTYREPEPGFLTPPASLTIRILEPPKKITWIEAFGLKKVAEKYIKGQGLTGEDTQQHRSVRLQQLTKPKRFTPDTAKKLVELTEQKDELMWPDGSRLVGGDVDFAKLTKGGRVQWLHQKASCKEAGGAP